MSRSHVEKTWRWRLNNALKICIVSWPSESNHTYMDFRKTGRQVTFFSWGGEVYPFQALRTHGVWKHFVAQGLMIQRMNHRRLELSLVMFHGFNPNQQCWLVGWERDSSDGLIFSNTLVGIIPNICHQPTGVSCKKNHTFVNGHQPPKLFSPFFQHQ